jgi:hypothetical protein
LVIQLLRAGTQKLSWTNGLLRSQTFLRVIDPVFEPFVTLLWQRQKRGMDGLVELLLRSLLVVHFVCDPAAVHL